MQSFLVTPQAAVVRGASCIGQWLLGLLVVGYLAAALLLAFQMAWSASFMTDTSPAGFLLVLVVMLGALAGPISLWAVTLRHGWTWVLPALGVLFVLGFAAAPDDLLDSTFAGLALMGLGATATACVATGPVAEILLWARRRMRA